MAIRRLIRGRVEWDRIEAVARELQARNGGQSVGRGEDEGGDEPMRVTFLEADNWLSLPCVVDERWFVKIISPQNSLIHALFTTGRNIGAVSSGDESFFEHYGDPVEMAEHELTATERIRELGVSAPEPVEAFEVDGLGVLVLEYIPDFRSLSECSPEEVEALAPALFESLATMHADGLAHGDLRGENVLVRGDDLYFIDATNVRDGMAGAAAYDLACALGTLEPIIGAKAAVAAASEHHDAETLLHARDFLDFVNLRPDHDFDAASVRGEIEQASD